MNRFFLFSFFFFLFGLQLVAQDGYQIKVKIDGFQEKEAYLGYHLLDKQYIRDTVQINDKGELVFEGSSELAGGVYLLIMPPENQYFPLLISEGEQHFTMETKLDDPFANMNIKGSEDNKMYYKYMEYLSQKVPMKNKLFEEIKAAGDDAGKKSTIQKQLVTLDEEVRLYHKNLVDKFPKAFTSLLAKSRIEIEEPDSNNEWILQSTVTLLYNTENALTQIINQSVIGSTLVNTIQTINSYNSDNQLVTELRQSWVNENWQNANRTTDIYSEAENLIFRLEEEWDFNWIPYDRTYYYYEEVTSINELEANPLNLQIAPNPSDGMLNISFDQIVNGASIYVYNLQGQLLLREKITGQVNQKRLNLEQLSVGTYILQLNAGDQTSVRKIQIAH